MKRSPSRAGLPLSVRRALRKLGEDLSVARRRRRITMAMMAERALIDRKTLRRVERGDPGVSMGIYATVLFVLGMADRLESVADPRADRVGSTLEQDQLPKRVRVPRRTTK
jgi:DNA-binding XRE family transcriptional regulator